MILILEYSLNLSHHHERYKENIKKSQRKWDYISLLSFKKLKRTGKKSHYEKIYIGYLLFVRIIYFKILFGFLLFWSLEKSLKFICDQSLIVKLYDFPLMIFFSKFYKPKLWNLGILISAVFWIICFNAKLLALIMFSAASIKFCIKRYHWISF